MDENAKKLIKDGDNLFTKRQGMNHLWQEISLNFYPERADFTTPRNVGEEFADHLMNSYPVLARRDLGNSIAAMLRRDEWFSMEVADRTVDGAGKRWLEAATKAQRKAMYDRVARFKRATAEGDHDYSAFGQAGITVSLNKQRTAFLYKCWHLRDLAWCENDEGETDTVHQKWYPTARDLMMMFPQSIDPRAKEMAEKQPYETIPCRRIVLPAEYYDSYGVGGLKGRKTKFVSVYVDEKHQCTMQEVGLNLNPWVIPRWQTVAGSQYAYSPATIVALPDARLIQAMTLVLLEAGEKSANPPLLATTDAVRSEIDIRPGGVTWVDQEYDERLGAALRPLEVDRRGIPIGMEMAAQTRAMIMEAFYLNKLTLPMQAGDMTATEVSQRVQEYIRQALPLFEPMEETYNAALCEATFDLGMANGLFGPIEDIPRSLRGQDIQFKFVSPLRAAVEREKGSRYGEAIAMVTAGQPVDPTIAANVDFNMALRDALEGVGVPANWIRDEQDAAEYREQIEAQQQAAQIAAMAEAAGKAAPAIEAIGGEI